MKKLFLICLTCLIALPFALGASGDASSSKDSKSSKEAREIERRKAREAEKKAARKKQIARCLYGKIRIVASGEHVKVRVVDEKAKADLDVKFVRDEEKDWGLGWWHLVNEEHENYRIRFVENGEDITIKFVRFGPPGTGLY